MSTDQSLNRPWQFYSKPTDGPCPLMVQFWDKNFIIEKYQTNKIGIFNGKVNQDIFCNKNLLNHILKWTPLHNLVSCPVHIREFCEDYQKSHRAWLHCRHPVLLLPYREIRLSAQPSVSNRATREDKYTITLLRSFQNIQEHQILYRVLPKSDLV